MSRTDDPHPRVKRLRAMGMPADVIFHRLVLEGWSEDDIKNASGQRPEVPSATQAVGTMKEMEEKMKEHETWSEIPEEIVEVASLKRFSLFTLTLAVVAAVIMGASLYIYLQPPAAYSITIPSADGVASSSNPVLTFGALPELAQSDYYAEVKSKLVSQKVSFIDANLTSMQLTVYKDGVLSLVVPIKAKGKIGSWWETPAGLYKIETKEKNHFSTLGQVDMPYSLDFQGNFFIHGWPTHEDGTPVATDYSGGCIRLSTDDAQKVYELAAVGMPVVVYNQEPLNMPFSYELKAPAISAAEYLVADLDSGTVLTEKEANTPAPIASVTKLVTALVSTEYINLDKQIVVPPEAIVYTSVPRLKVGQSFKAYDLLFLLLQESSNEAAETLAAAVGRDQFVRDMNKKAQAIGLMNTTFNDPSGAKSDISTPADLFKLLSYIYDNRRFVFGLTTGEIIDSAYGKPAFGYIGNFNQIKNTSAKLLGGKIGQTNEAGETYAGVFSVKVGDTERKMAVIVLDSKDVQTDVAKLLNFVHSQYAPAQ